MNTIVTVFKEVRAVKRSEVKLASDKRAYFSAEFAGGFGQKNVSRLFWQQKKKDSAGVETLVWERGTPEEFDTLVATGQKIEGIILNYPVVPYPVGDNTVSTYTTVMFPGENAVSLFASLGHNIMDGDEILGKVRPAKAPKAVITSPEGAEAAVENAIAEEQTV